MRKQLAFVFILISSSSFASHIVGGEFELLHVQNFRYRLNLIIYFDVLNGNEQAEDSFVTVRFFRKADHTPIMDIFIPKIGAQRVEYFQPDCSMGEIVTNRLEYSTEITLSDEIFNDLGGYYVVWESQCVKHFRGLFLRVNQ